MYSSTVVRKVTHAVPYKRRDKDPWGSMWISSRERILAARLRDREVDCARKSAREEILSILQRNSPSPDPVSTIRLALLEAKALNEEHPVDKSVRYALMENLQISFSTMEKNLRTGGWKRVDDWGIVDEDFVVFRRWPVSEERAEFLVIITHLNAIGLDRVNEELNYKILISCSKVAAELAKNCVHIKFRLYRRVSLWQDKVTYLGVHRLEPYGSFTKQNSVDWKTLRPHQTSALSKLGEKTKKQCEAKGLKYDTSVVDVYILKRLQFDVKTEEQVGHTLIP